MTDLKPYEAARLARVFIAEKITLPIESSLKLTGGVLSFRMDNEAHEGQRAVRALMAHHLSVDIDEYSSESRVRMNDGFCCVEIDVLPELWREKETVAPRWPKKL